IKSAGYRIELIFLYTSSPAINALRVAQRVSQGGNYVPAETIARRYQRGLQLLPVYLELADAAEIIDASENPRTVLTKKSGRIAIQDKATWRAILKPP